MKNLTFLVLLIIQLNSFSQTKWSFVDDQHGKSFVTENALLQDSIFLVGSHISITNCYYHYLAAHDLNGNFLWGNRSLCDVIFTNEHSVFAAGFTPIDDVLGIEQIIISKYSANGNLLWKKGHPEIPHEFLYEFVPVCMAEDDRGNLFIGSKNSILKTDSAGNVLFEKQLSLSGDIFSVIPQELNRNFVISEYTIYKTDSLFTISDSLSLHDENVQSLMFNDILYNLTSHNLFVVDENLSVTDTLITNSEISFNELEVFNGALYIQGIQGDKIKIIKIVNQDLSDTLTFDKLVESPKFLISDQSVIFSGTSESGLAANYAMYLDNSQNELDLPDIEITDFNIKNIEFQYVGLPDTLFAWGYYFDTDVTVKNNGQDTVTSFAIYAELHGGFNCARNNFWQRFTNIEILPNEELTVSLHRTYEEDYKNNNTLCFECLAPNSRLESDYAKNKLCKTFTIDGVDFKNQNQFKIYPNPTNASINIDNANDFSAISIYNYSGQLVFGRLINNESKIEIDLNGLNPGLYFIQLNNDKHTVTSKLIKTD